MSEGKGFAVIVKLNLKPVAQYANGNSVIYQGDTVDEVAELIGQSLGLGVEQGKTVLAAFGNAALAQAAGVVLAGPPSAVAPAVTEAAAPAAGATTGDELASAALLAVVASKSGKSVEELGSLTTKEAKQQLAIAKSKATKATKEGA